MQKNKKISPESLRRRPLGRYRYVRLRWRVLFSIIDSLGTVAFAAVRLAVGMFSPRRAEKPQEPSRILIVQLDHIGDAVITTVMPPLLRRRYPNASIEVLCGPWNRDFFQAIDEVDRVHVSHLNRFLRGNDNSLPKRFAWTAAVFVQGLRLRRENFDLGIDVRGEFPNALMLWLSGAKRRLGWSCGGGGFLLTDIAPFEHTRPEVESRLALLAKLGISPDDRKDSWPRFQPSASARRSVGEKLASGATAGLSSSADNTAGQASSGTHQNDYCRALPLVAVHVSAGTAAKCWPVEHWRQLVDMFRQGGARVVLVGGPGDRAVSRSIRGRRRPPDVVDFTGRLGVVELAALLERADLLVGCDSGPAHLATAVRTPVVVLFSGTNNSRQWRPRGPNVAVVRHSTPCGPCHSEKCPRRAHPCMRKIQPADVLRAAARFISICDNQETVNHDRSASTAANETDARRPPVTQGT